MWGDISPSPPGEIKALATHPRIAAGDALNNSSQKAFSLKIKASSHPHNASHRRPQITVSKSPTASENQPLRFKQFPVLQARNVTSPRASSEPQPHPTSWRGPQTPLPHWVPTSQPSQPAQAGSSPSTLQLMSNNATIDSREEGKASENRRHTLIRDQECDLVRGSCAQRAATRALPGPASPVRPGRLGDPPPLLYLRCWGWPGGSGARRTGEGTSRGGPYEVQSSSRPETQGCSGGRRHRPEAAGVPHPGAASPASSSHLR